MESFGEGEEEGKTQLVMIPDKDLAGFKRESFMVFLLCWGFLVFFFFLVVLEFCFFFSLVFTVHDTVTAFSSVFFPCCS